MSSYIILYGIEAISFTYFYWNVWFIYNINVIHILVPTSSEMNLDPHEPELLKWTQ